MTEAVTLFDLGVVLIASFTIFGIYLLDKKIESILKKHGWKQCDATDADKKSETEKQEKHID